MSHLWGSIFVCFAALLADINDFNLTFNYDLIHYVVGQVSSLDDQ